MSRVSQGLNTEMPLIVQDLFSYWTQDYLVKNNNSEETVKRLQRFMLPQSSVDGSTQTLRWSSTKRAKTWLGDTTLLHLIALSQRRHGSSVGPPGSTDEWENEALEYYCHLRNVHGPLVDGRRLGRSDLVFLFIVL